MLALFYVTRLGFVRKQSICGKNFVFLWVFYVMNSMQPNLLMHRTTQCNRTVLCSARLRAYEIFQSFYFTCDIPHFYKPTLFCKQYLWLLTCVIEQERCWSSVRHPGYNSDEAIIVNTVPILNILWAVHRDIFAK